MFWTTILVLLVLWLLGLILGASVWIRVLPALASILFLWRLALSRRRT